ncbi:proline dehydrogenase family protein [Homoserinibacter sp. GY 40078]|uniref:proline dehydrogenase family protein n=1 Tax=Homoserinibacter sp. GY 40078 TaxID=2603275 RepID=UPI0011CC42BB|nr:proline dehydrogenase family protein [Homoserinibacter sp. GY 40078]TXK19956.1 aldehyde dehydrogenase family protein [Homoserinibacter sp. GY 40078]
MTPASPASASPSAPDDEAVADAVVARVRKWLETAETLPVDPSAKRLAGLLRDPEGLDFAVGFVDGVIRPEDSRVAARTLARLAKRPPRFLAWPLRTALRIGGMLAPVLPGIVVPIARSVLRGMVAHLVIDANDPGLGRALRRIRARGARPNVNLLGEAVLGAHEAGRRLDGTRRLLARDDVDYVSIKVSATVAPHSPWAFDEAVDDIVEALTPLFEQAAAATPAKFVNLDMEEYKDLDLTIAVFQRILDQEALRGLEAGIVLQAYLPDALGAYLRLREWAHARRAAGGAGIKVRLVKGANLPMERVDASLHDWPLATWHSKQASDTNYKRILDVALRPENIADVRLGVAGHNLFDLAYARHLATTRGVDDGIEIEMLLGMAPAQAEAVRRDVGGLLLYTPVVAASDFDSAIAYLIRRLEEGASSDNFMSAVFELASSEQLFARERDRFLASLADVDDVVPPPHRVQDRTRVPAAVEAGFHNAPDTDPAVAANRGWARAALDRSRSTTLGAGTVNVSAVPDAAAVDRVLTTAVAASTGWASRGADARAAILHRAGQLLEERRDAFIEIMAAEGGKTVDQSDPEVSEAIDFAHYYAERGRELDDLDGAEFVPAQVTLVVPPWNFPLAIPAGSTLAALASGSAVVFKPARRTARTAAVLAEALWDAGVPREVLQFVVLGGGEVSSGALGEELIADERVDQVILTGGYETAELFRTFRPGVKLLAETSGKNSIIVTPSADLDLAVRDVAYSAFGHAGQKCSAASLAILVGSVAESRRFREQLLDAVRSMPVGDAADPTNRMGPIIAPAEGKLLDALTRLAPGESWLLEPRRLDDEGRIWSPGIKSGVLPGSEFHLTEYFGPVLGIMHARTLDEALELQNAVDYGLTAGLHSLDAGEIARWIDRVEAGNLYVNRGTTGAIVQRQPFGGWKRSVVGPGAKAGGPNYLLGLGTVRPTAALEAVPALDPAADRIVEVFGARGSAAQAMLQRAAASDRRAWSSEFGTVRDVTGLTAERNAFRYRALPVTVRAEAGADAVEVARVALAGLLSGSQVTLSTAAVLSPSELEALRAAGVDVRSEDATAFVREAARLRDTRIRLIGGRADELLTSLGGRPDIAVYDGPVTESGRVELLPFLREQAVSITAHRFGTPSVLVEALPLVETA